LHNGQGSGDTETGAYTLLGGSPIPSNGLSITRNPNATWFIPSEDEWYKAAYHKNDGDTGNYWDYPTSSDAVPDNNLPSSDTGNSANFNPGPYTTGDIFHPLTDAGSYTLSVSPYGTFDQGGSVWEWTEGVIDSSLRGIRGGSWEWQSTQLASSDRTPQGPTAEGSDIGFRVASIPEPTTFVLTTIGLVGLGCRRRK